MILRAALTSNANVVATSNVLTVASGRPVQRAASLSAAKFAIEGGNIDGQTSDITMSLADRQGNPVPDGTQRKRGSRTGSAEAGLDSAASPVLLPG